VNPRRISKVTPAAKTFFMLAGLFYWLYWAVYFMVAWSMPKSLIIWMRLGAIRAMATKPYSEGERIRATRITPRAVMREEAATP